MNYATLSVGTSHQKTHLNSGGETHTHYTDIENILKYDTDDPTFIDLESLGFKIKKIITDENNEIPISLTFTNQYILDADIQKEQKDKYNYFEITRKRTIKNKNILLGYATQIIDITSEHITQNKTIKQYWNATLQDNYIKSILNQLDQQDLTELFVNMYNYKLMGSIDEKIIKLDLYDQQKLTIDNEDELNDFVALFEPDITQETASIKDLFEKLPQNAIDYLTDEKIKMIEDSEYYKKMLSTYECKIEELNKMEKNNATTLIDNKFILKLYDKMTKA